MEILKLTLHSYMMKHANTHLYFQLQSPESFAKSVQELTIVLQRTGDPANLNRLRPHLELLANIDPNPGKQTKLFCFIFFKSLHIINITAK